MRRKYYLPRRREERKGNRILGIKPGDLLSRFVTLFVTPLSHETSDSGHDARTSSFPRKRESSRVKVFWIPDQVRDDCNKEKWVLIPVTVSANTNTVLYGEYYLSLRLSDELPKKNKSHRIAVNRT